MCFLRISQQWFFEVIDKSSPYGFNSTMVFASNGFIMQFWPTFISMAWCIKREKVSKKNEKLVPEGSSHTLKLQHRRWSAASFVFKINFYSETTLQTTLLDIPPREGGKHGLFRWLHGLCITLIKRRPSMAEDRHFFFQIGWWWLQNPAWRL